MPHLQTRQQTQQRGVRDGKDVASIQASKVVVDLS